MISIIVFFHGIFSTKLTFEDLYLGMAYVDAALK